MKILQADLAKSTTSIKVKNTTISRLLNAIRVNLTQIYATDGFEKKKDRLNASLLATILIHPHSYSKTRNTQYYPCFLSFIIISSTYYKLNKTNIANKVRSRSGNLVHQKTWPN